MTSTNKLETFDIRNFLDRLTPAKEKNKYICPVCEGNDLGIDPNTGAYQCFNGCTCKDIREAIRPWDEAMEDLQQQKSRSVSSSYSSKPKKQQNTKNSSQKQKLKSIPLPEGRLAIARLAETPTDVPQPVKPQIVSKSVRQIFVNKGATPEEIQKIKVITYDYGDQKFVHRYECPIAAIDKGYEKTFLVSRVDESGKTAWNKGAYAWAGYRQAEAIAALKAIEDDTIPVLLSHEGEGCLEAARGERLAGITFQGGAKLDDLICILNDVKSQMGDRLFILAHCQDNDQAGLKKSETIGEACARCGIAFVAIDLKRIKLDLLEKGDVVDILTAGMTGDDLAQEILKEIERIRAAEAIDSINDDEDDEELEDEDTLHPEAFYKSICKSLGLDFNNCVSAQSFDLWVYHRIFTGAENWRVIDSAFYRWSEVRQIWEHQNDVVVLSMIADAGGQAFRLSHTKTFGWQVTYPYGTDGHKKSAFGYAKSRLERPEPLPANNHLLAFKNCVVDLRTGEQMPHDKKYYLTNMVPLDYHANAECPEVFRQFIADSFGEEMLEVIRAFSGAFLDPTAPYGRFPHLIGQSGGGKGTLGRFWGNLFGESGSGSASGFGDLSSPEGRHQFLTGKRIFGFPDLGGHQQGVRSFYELIDNGPLTGRALFSPVAYSKQWFTRFWVASVDHLQIENAGDGWARRAYPIPVKSRNVVPDPDLRQKLEEVKAEVISWALAMPREERDRILLSPPDRERAINAQLDAALYGDSTKSFVDLCLRPTKEQVSVSHDLLHSWYVCYCKQHGYTPLGMSKFISHLKTILPRHFVDRHWTPTVNGKRQRIAAHWENIMSLPGAFMSWLPGGGSGENSAPPVQEQWDCIKRNCREGGLEEFEDFWKPSSEQSIEQIVIDSTPTVNDAIPTVIDSTPTVNDAIPTVIDSTPTVNDAIPTVIDSTPTVIDSTPTVIDSTPTVIEQFEDVEGNAELLSDPDMDVETLQALTGAWSPEFKKVVWDRLTLGTQQRLKKLKLQSG